MKYNIFFYQKLLNKETSNFDHISLFKYNEQLYCIKNGNFLSKIPEEIKNKIKEILNTYYKHMLENIKQWSSNFIPDNQSEYILKICEDTSILVDIKNIKQKSHITFYKNRILSFMVDIDEIFLEYDKQLLKSKDFSNIGNYTGLFKISGFKQKIVKNIGNVFYSKRAVICTDLKFARAKPVVYYIYLGDLPIILLYCNIETGKINILDLTAGKIDNPKQIVIDILYNIDNKNMIFSEKYIDRIRSSVEHYLIFNDMEKEFKYNNGLIDIHDEEWDKKFTKIIGIIE